MAKLKYRYNPEKLSYDVITTTARERLKKFGFMFAASIVVSVIYFTIYSKIYDTPKERTLTNKLSAIRFNYQMLLQDLNNVENILSDIQKRDDDIYRTVLESEPIPNSIRQAGFGGVNRYESLEGFQNSNLMISATKYTEKIEKQLYVQSISYDELIAKAIHKEQMTASRPAIQPVSKKHLKSIGKYGMRLHPVLKYWRMHQGMDFSANTGDPVYVTGDGTVIRAEFNAGGYGNVIIIDHGFGYQTVYAHLSRIGVLVGNEVKRGQVIGAVGNTGLSKSPHLHYEVHKNGTHVNPIHYFYNDLSMDEYYQFVENSQSNEIFEDWQASDEEMELKIEE
jgi:murein DD-endopeptidase MepM/ murein hydrolase activator NlpD